MAEYLVIRLPDAPDDPASWVLVDDQGRAVGSVRSGPLSDASGLAPGRRVLAIVPATDVLRTNVELPIRNQAKLLQALPFTLEDQLAQDVDSLHFAATRASGRKSGEQPVEVAAVDRTRLEDWLSALAGAGVPPDGVYAESDALRGLPSTVTVTVLDARVFVADGETPALVFDGLGVEEALELSGLVDEDGRIGHVVAYVSPSDAEIRREEWEALRERALSLDVHVLPDGPLPRMAANALGGGGVNLLQGPYAPRSALAPLLKPWRNAAILAGVFLTAALAAAGVEYVQLKRTADALDAEIYQTFRRAFPNQTTVSDYRLQMERELRRLGGTGQGGAAGESLLLGLDRLSAAMRDAERTRITALSYRNGVLDLRVRAPDVDTLDKLRQGVIAGGRLSAELQSANPVEGGVEGRLQLSETGA